MATKLFLSLELRNHKWLPLLSLLLLSSVLAWARQTKAPEAAETKAPETTETFPIAPGTSWIYRGIVRWTHDVNKVSEIKVAWKMEVQRVIRHGECTGAVIRGFPSDLDWSDGHANPADSLVVRLGQGKFYLIGQERLASTIQLLENPKESLEGLLSEGDLFLQLPLAQGNKYCGSANMARTDGRYCWIVESSEPVNLAKLTAGALQGRGTSFRLRYVTNPDDVAYDFVPGVGLTSYQYHHHGTVADTELHLSGFHRGVPANE